MRYKKTVRLSLLIAAAVWLAVPAAVQAAEFDTPEATLDTYLAALREGDRTKVARCFEPPAYDFYLPGPLPLGQRVIVKRIVYGRAEVEDWNSKGIKPPAALGDIELQVQEIIDGRPQMFSYNFRRFGTDWKIYSHAAWDVD